MAPSIEQFRSSGFSFFFSGVQKKRGQVYFLIIKKPVPFSFEPVTFLRYQQTA
jgi:hypothetical protein